jgi:hypothetical protein
MRAELEDASRKSEINLICLIAARDSCRDDLVDQEDRFASPSRKSEFRIPRASGIPYRLMTATGRTEDGCSIA